MNPVQRPSYSLLVLLVLGASLGSASCLGPREVAEAGETLAQGSETDLQDELRPVRGQTRVLILALDGVGHDELLRAIQSGAMPRLGGALGIAEDGTMRHGFAHPKVLSILPSTTVASWTSIFTGYGPAETGITGNEQLIREPLAFFAPAPVTVSDLSEVMDTVNDSAVGRVVKRPTLYERADLRAHVSMAHLHQGADVFTLPGGADLLEVFGAFLGGSVDGDGESGSMEVYRELDEESVGAVLEAAEDVIPDIQVAYFPGVDLFTHVADPALEEQRSYVKEVLDPQIGRLLDHWGEAGVLEDTYLILTADHGHTPVLQDDRHALDVDGDDEPTKVLENMGFRLRPYSVGEHDEPTFQAAVAYQGAFAYVYLADRSTCIEEEAICDWRKGPRLEEDVLPVARAFWEASASGAGVPELKGAIDLVLAREPRPVDQEALPFQVFDGERLVPIGEYLAANPRPELLAFEERLRDLAAGPYGHRAGDVLLMAKTGTQLPIEERFYFSGPYHSWHGSATEQDSHVPVIVGRPGYPAIRIEREVRSRMPARYEGWSSHLDFTPMVLGLLRVE